MVILAQVDTFLRGISLSCQEFIGLANAQKLCHRRLTATVTCNIPNNKCFTWELVSIPHNDSVVNGACRKPDVMRGPGNVQHIAIVSLQCGHTPP